MKAIYLIGIISLFNVVMGCPAPVNELEKIPTLRLTPPEPLISDSIRLSVQSNQVPASMAFNSSGCWAYTPPHDMAKFIIETGILLTDGIDGLTQAVNHSFQYLKDHQNEYIPVPGKNFALRINYNGAMNQYYLELFNYNGTVGSLFLWFEWSFDAQFMAKGKVVYDRVNSPATPADPNIDFLRADFNFQDASKGISVVLHALPYSAAYIDDSKVVLQKNSDNSYEGNTYFTGRDQPCWPSVTAAKPSIQLFFYADAAFGSARGNYNNVVVPVDTNMNTIPNGYLTDLSGKEYYDVSATPVWVDLNHASAQFTMVANDDASEAAINSTMFQIGLTTLFPGTPGTEPMGIHKTKVDGATLLTEAFDASDGTFWDPFIVP